MNVHDLIFAVGSGIFAVSLVPAVVKRTQMPLSSSLPTAIVLSAFLANYVWMGFAWSAVTTACTALCWWALVVRRDSRALPIKRS